MAKTVNTGWRKVTPGKCLQCGSDDDWSVDGRGNVLCGCQACPDCGIVDAYGFHERGCPRIQENPKKRRKRPAPAWQQHTVMICPRCKQFFNQYRGCACKRNPSKKDYIATAQILRGLPRECAGPATRAFAAHYASQGAAFDRARFAIAAGAPGANPRGVKMTGLCPVCGKRVRLVGQTVDRRYIGSCRDAFTKKQWYARSNPLTPDEARRALQFARMSAREGRRHRGAKSAYAYGDAKGLSEAVMFYGPDPYGSGRVLRKQAERVHGVACARSPWRKPRRNPGKFPNATVRKLYEMSLDGADEEVGDAQTTGWYGLMVDTGIRGALHVILYEDSQGFVEASSFSSAAAARKKFDRIARDIAREFGDADFNPARRRRVKGRRRSSGKRRVVKCSCGYRGPRGSFPTIGRSRGKVIIGCPACGARGGLK